jgi:outer membrane protein TolC
MVTLSPTSPGVSPPSPTFGGYFPLRGKIRAAIVASVVALGGCAEFSPDGGMSAVTQAAQRDLGAAAAKISTDAQAAQRRARVDALLAAPLGADQAVEIALLSNRGLQAAYNDLGLAEAAAVGASLPPNPRFSLERIAAGPALGYELRLIGNILALATLPARREIAQAQFRQAQSRAIEATFRLAIDTRRAYLRALAAAQLASLLEQSRGSADAAAELMRRLGETGGANKLDQARTAAFYAELSAQLAQARLRARVEKEALTRLLGLWGKDVDFRLPPALPALPPSLHAVDNIEAEAIRRRVDLTIARQELDVLARSLKLTQATRSVSLIELSGIGVRDRERGEDGTRRHTGGGFELEIEIPLFDGGEVADRQAQEAYRRAVNRLAEKAINARSEARAAWQTRRGAWDIARLYQGRVLPLRRTISEEVLLRYNAMQIDVFELLVEARERIASNMAALEARRDFFLAEADLQAALIGGGSSMALDAEAPRAAASGRAGH